MPTIAGNDQFFGGAGSDTFFWDPGDGDDLIEGGAGDSDQLFFFGNAGAEQFFLFADTATPSRFHLFRVQAAIDIDAADLEEVNLTTLGGADTVTVGRSDLGVLSDLSTTTVRAVDVSLGVDAAATTSSSKAARWTTICSSASRAGIVKVAGLSYDLRIDGSDPALDRLTVQGNEGNDVIKAVTGVEARIAITLNGNQGDDTLSADAILNGGRRRRLPGRRRRRRQLNGGAGEDTDDRPGRRRHVRRRPGFRHDPGPRHHGQRRHQCQSNGRHDAASTPVNGNARDRHAGHGGRRADGRERSASRPVNGNDTIRVRGPMPWAPMPRSTASASMSMAARVNLAIAWASSITGRAT